MAEISLPQPYFGQRWREEPQAAKSAGCHNPHPRNVGGGEIATTRIYAARPARCAPDPLRALHGLDAALAGADAHTLLNRVDEDLAVAHLAGARHVADESNQVLDLRVIDNELNLHLGDHVEHDLLAAIVLGPAVLASAAHDLVDGHAVDALLV